MKHLTAKGVMWPFCTAVAAYVIKTFASPSLSDYSTFEITSV